jgi:hypothetical protein
VSAPVSKDESDTSIGRLDDTLRALKMLVEQTVTNQNDAARQNADKITEMQRIANKNAEEQKLAIRHAIATALANQNDGMNAMDVNGQSANQNGMQRMSERRPMSECGDEREPTRKRTVSNSEKTARAFVSIRKPEAFKVGQDVRASLQRLDQHFTAANIVDEVTQANTLANALSSDVHAALFKLKLSQETRNDPRALKAILTRQYDDSKTTQTYVNEFQNAKQCDNETIIAFSTGFISWHCKRTRNFKSETMWMI